MYAKLVFNKMACKNMLDYTMLYLKTDICQLADVFENFRNLSMDVYGLDPAHYFTAPGLFWDSMLKMTGVKLELLTDIDMVTMIEKGTRGGISMISHRHAIANNKYMQADKQHIEKYNAWCKERGLDINTQSYILYLDANNLYGWAMSQHLPSGGFTWDANEWTQANILDLKDDADDGYIFMVDLEYPKELHDLHNMYPLAPEKLHVDERFYSDYNIQVAAQNDHKITPCDKLVPNLMDKSGYVVHYRNLKLYLQQGLKIKKIHKVLRFKQSPWLSQYIDLNSSLRKKAKNDFEKDFFKLANNSVFGKTMENVRKRCNIKLVKEDTNSKKSLEKRLSDMRITNITILNEDLCAVHKVKTSVTLDKPSYVGMCILDLSKVLMYNFHYNHMLPKYGVDMLQLLFTDTDSLCYHIITNDVYNDMQSSLEKFDTSDYPENHPLFSTMNKKVIGKFKDETNSHPIIEFAGVCPKVYGFQVMDGTKVETKKRAKGTSKVQVKKSLSFDNYLQCVMEAKTTNVKQHSIRSYKHKMYTIEQNKLALSPIDTKRWLMNDGISSLAHGHYAINRK